MESVILITRIFFSGFSSIFIRLNVVVLLHRKDANGKIILSEQERFLVDTKKLVVPYNFIHNLLKRKWHVGFQPRSGIEALLIERGQCRR